MSDFGALTDHFGVLAMTAGAGTLDDILVLVDSSKDPASDSEADATDENNDPAATTYYGAGDIEEASSTFDVIKGDFDTALILLGEIDTGKCIESVAATTSNTAWPRIVVSGKLGCETMVAPTGKLNTFTNKSVTIANRKQAQPLGFTVGNGCKLTGSSMTSTIELAQTEDGLGEPAAHAVSGGKVVVTGEFVRVTAAPSWTVTSPGIGLTQTKAPGLAEGQAAYHTASAEARGTIVRDTAP
jgi:hypothetical protein